MSNYRDQTLEEVVTVAGKRIAEAITPILAGGRDEAGGYVESLTEAVMGVTKALMAISYSLDAIAEVIREHRAE